MSQIEKSPKSAKGSTSAWPTADQLRGMNDPVHELYGKSWASERGWHDEEEDEVTIIVRSPRPAEGATQTGTRGEDKQEPWTPLQRGSEAWVRGRALFHAASEGRELSETEKFLALSYVNSRSEEDGRDDFLFGMRDQGHLVRRYLKPRTRLGRFVDRLLQR